MPRVVAAPKYQHVTELGGDLERIVVDVLTAKHPQAPPCTCPPGVQVEQHCHDLLPGVGVDVSVTIAFSIAVSAYRNHGRIVVQVDPQLALDDAPEVLTLQL